MNKRILSLVLIAAALTNNAYTKPATPQKKLAKPIASSKAQEAQEIESMGQLREVLSKREPVVLMFYAAWCGPCKSMKDAYDTIAARFHGRAHVAKINADLDASKEMLDFLGVEATPTLIFRNVGVMSEDQLQKVLTAFTGEPSKKKDESKPVKSSKKKVPAKKPQAKKPSKKK